MELINTAHTIRSKLIHAVRDPFGTITCNDLDAGTLLVGQLPVKRFQNCFAMAIRSPYNSVGVMIDYDRDVFMTFLIAGLIDPYIYKVIKAFRAFWLNDIQCTVHASADRFPVYPHAFGYDTARQVYSKPTNREVKVLCKPTFWIGPWNVSNNNSVFGAFDTVRVIGYFNKGCASVQSSPCAWLRILLVIASATLMAEWTIIHAPSIGAGVDANVIHSILIRVKIAFFYNCMLDIEQFLA